MITNWVIFFPTLCCCFLHFIKSNYDGSKQKISFHAHLFFKVTEVCKVWLLHFILGSFLWNVDKRRNLMKETWQAVISHSFLSLLIYETCVQFRGTAEALFTWFKSTWGWTAYLWSRWSWRKSRRRWRPATFDPYNPHKIPLRYTILHT